MSKIAIDIALIPPTEIMDLCIELNQKSSEQTSVLNKKDNLPHITLAMGAADEKDLGVINKKLENIVKNFTPLNLEILDLYYHLTPKNKKSYCFAIKPTEELVNLHAVIMKELLPILSYEVSLDMFYKDKGEEVDDVSISWVENYGEKHADPNNYQPHISLKVRDAKYDNSPIKFTASKLALCHLGDHCTCRKVFKIFELEKKV